VIFASREDRADLALRQCRGRGAGAGCASGRGTAGERRRKGCCGRDCGSGGRRVGRCRGRRGVAGGGAALPGEARRCRGRRGFARGGAALPGEALLCQGRRGVAGGGAALPGEARRCRGRRCRRGAARPRVQRCRGAALPGVVLLPGGAVQPRLAAAVSGRAGGARVRPPSSQRSRKMRRHSPSRLRPMASNHVSLTPYTCSSSSGWSSRLQSR
jgi:hypothetical protein